MMEIASLFGFGCFLGLLGGLIFVLAWKPRKQKGPKPQYIPGNMAIVYAVVRFACGCFLTNGVLTTCQAHSILEEVER